MINKNEIGENEGRNEIYIKGRLCTEDEVMPLSRSRANGIAPCVQAFNKGCSRQSPIHDFFSLLSERKLNNKV